MPSSSSQGLRVTPSTVIKRKRRLPVAGEILVQTGDLVTMNTIVARTLLPGMLHPLNATGRLALPPAELRQALRVRAGDAVTRGQLLAEKSILFGWLRSQLCSPIDGSVEAVSDITGQMTLRENPSPLELLAYLPGEVVTVEPGVAVEIEARVCQVQGIFGLGGEAYGPLEGLGGDRTAAIHPEMVTAEHKGKILFTRDRVPLGVLEALIQCGAKGLVAASASGRDLMALTGGDLNPAATGNEALGFTLVLTEGFGEISMSQRTHRILGESEGQWVSVNGRTQIRAGVIRPELIAAAIPDTSPPTARGEQLSEGDPVRIIRGHAFGKLATIKRIPTKLRTIGSGAKALVFIVALEGGKEIVVPRPNVEPIVD